MKTARVLFLNQVAGPLFRELADDVARYYGGADLVTGAIDDSARAVTAELTVTKAPSYNRRNVVTRAVSWFLFFIVALHHALRSRRGQLLFIVSNPPFLPLVGWLSSVLRGQHYCILVYDVYPALLVNLGKLAHNGLVARLWQAFNRMVWSRSAAVMTIGPYMAENIRNEAPQLRSDLFKIVPMWCDCDFIKPIPKADNPFVTELGWQDRKIILYSGNLGNTHNLTGLLAAAFKLKNRPDIGFLIVGSGALWGQVEHTVAEQRLTNVKLLPWQPEDKLPYTQAAGDISVISIEPTIAGYMLPGKTFYYLAAGSALIALAAAKSELTDIIEGGRCGVRLDPDDGDGIAAAIVGLVDEPERLLEYQLRSRHLAETQYSRKNTVEYLAILDGILRVSERDGLIISARGKD